MRNFILNVFGKLDSISDKGFLFQNFIFNILSERLKETSTTINFWRTQDKAEVDFVLNFGNNYIPIEVKYSLIKKPVVSRSLLSFIKKYNHTQAFKVSKLLRFSISINLVSKQYYFVSICSSRCPFAIHES